MAAKPQIFTIWPFTGKASLAPGLGCWWLCGWGLWPGQTHDSSPPFLPQPGSIDSNNQLFAPGGRLSWGKGSSGGSGAKPSDAGREATVKSWVISHELSWVEPCLHGRLVCGAFSTEWLGNAGAVYHLVGLGTEML